jgi:hypothetical protein
MRMPTAIIMDKPVDTAMKSWVLALTSVASFMAALDAMVVATALGTIRLDLDQAAPTSLPTGTRLQWTS